MIEVSMQLGPVYVKVEGATIKEAFTQLAACADAFNVGPCPGQETRNGQPSDRVYPSVRTVQDGKKTYTYYEWRCQDSPARLSMGEHLEGGTLYVKRYDSESKTTIGTNGWQTYRKEQNEVQATR